MTKLTHELERVLSTDVNSSILVDTVNDRSYSKAEILQKNQSISRTVAAIAT
ncbi:hypothetical protein [Oenococcus oeni]|uniref:hypothetical protein n=1 Tax=Oenococcus oeni TaxID=1247 RepID=UPI000AD1AEB1|nr:hypothetical protein [Oenococcus oeni]